MKNNSKWMWLMTLVVLIPVLAVSNPIRLAVMDAKIWGINHWYSEPLYHLSTQERARTLVVAARHNKAKDAAQIENLVDLHDPKADYEAIGTSAAEVRELKRRELVHKISTILTGGKIEYSDPEIVVEALDVQEYSLKELGITPAQAKTLRTFLHNYNLKMRLGKLAQLPARDRKK